MSRTNLLLTKKVFCLWCGSPLAPSHTINRHNKKYFYYRCTGSKNIGKKCKNSHFSTLKLEAEVSRIILSLSEEKQFSLIENKLLKHNEAININIHEQEKTLLHLETTLTLLKLKKDKYLDGLLSSEFIKQEKELIHNKIQELERDEKSLKSAILKQQLLINETKETLINITEIKKLLISYKSNHPFPDIRHHKTTLAEIIESVHCSKNSLEIKFLSLPWKEVFNMDI
ncbi:MAG: zinc ribbon domain-containing protein [Candidatus Margulisbacteria bacterium]|nr:zinc ribbon domain-containing protein [Candidatus Margulisiibacteriota bacterium]